MCMKMKHRATFQENVLRSLSLAAMLAVLTGSAVFCQASKSSKTRASSPSSEGKILFKSHNCSACHTINASGGCLAPPLDGIAKRRSKSFITARITDNPSSIKRFQQLYGEMELMPHPRVPQIDAQQIAEYLLSLPVSRLRVKGHDQNVDPLTATKGRPTASQIDLTEGKQLLAESGCTACHSLGGLGGNFAPKFDNIGERLTMQSITDKVSRANFLIDGTDEYDKRGVSMPPANLTAEQVKRISAFLSSLAKH